MCFFFTRCTTFRHSLSVIVICCHSLSFVVTRFATCCHSLSFIVICCHSLSFVATRCTTFCHSLSLVAIRCHSLLLDVNVVCLFINDVSATDPAFAHLTYPFFFYLLASTVKNRLKYQRHKPLQQQKAIN